MIKTLLTLVTLLLYITSNAQKLESCSDCSLVKYSFSDIKNNKLFEIELLRNEIFARHNYSFKNQRLEEYYSKYEWYKPDYNSPNKKVQLNSTEEHNVTLFKTREEEIKKNRLLLIDELQQLKSAIKRNDTNYVETCFNGYEDSDTYYTELVNIINDVLSVVDLKDIHWHKDKAQYKIETDNGFSISTKVIYIEGNSVKISISDPIQHSDLMDDDAFEYPSGYYSESESTTSIEFELNNGKLILVNWFSAG